MLQDDSRELSRWLASRPDARQRATEAGEAIALERRLRRVQPTDIPNQGRDSEACRVASCRALGLDPADPLKFLTRPVVRFWTIVAGAVVSVLLIVQGVGP